MTCGKVDLGCKKCTLCAKRTNVVPGKGTCDSRIVFVGEAPGREEDLAAEPFVGRAGRLLEDTLAELGIERDSIFITNTCLCRPPDNRKPRRDEIETCTQLYFSSTIKAIRPKVICALGQTAAGFLLGTRTGMSKLVGKSRDIDVFGVRTRVFVAYHPAGALRTRKNLPAFKKAIKSSIRSAGLI